MRTETGQNHQYATFVVGGLYVGVDVLDVQEVLRGQTLTRVPLAAPVIDGLINLRGQIVPALDMRQVLGLPERDSETPPVSVVVRSSHGAVSLQVDEIEDVIELNTASFEAPPPHLSTHLRSLFAGVHKLEQRLLLVLNTQLAAESGI